MPPLYEIDEQEADRLTGRREMQPARNNQEWILGLSEVQEGQTEAISDLRALLLRAALYTFVSHLDDVREMEESERRALAEDCAQEALQAVMDRLGDFRGESKFTTWAYKFAVNIALTRIRRERWKAVSLDALSDNEETLDWLQWQNNLQTADSEMPALRSEAGALITQVIRSELTARQRQLLKWIAFDGIPMDVIVERMNSNRNAIYKQLHDARVKVKRQLSAHGYRMEEVYELFRVV